MSETKIILTTLSIVSIILLSAVVLGINSFDNQKSKNNLSSANLVSIGSSKLPESLTFSLSSSSVISEGIMQVETTKIESKNTDTSNIDKLVKNPELTEFLNLIKVAGMEGQVNSQDAITLFAPDNESFKLLPERMLENLKLPENKEHLQSIIQNHIFRGKVLEEQLKELEYITVANENSFGIRNDEGHIFVNDILITSLDTKDSNLIVHSINRVNLGYLGY